MCDQVINWILIFHLKKIKLIYLTLIIPPTSTGPSGFKSEALNILVIKGQIKVIKIKTVKIKVININFEMK